MTYLRSLRRRRALAIAGVLLLSPLCTYAKVPVTLNEATEHYGEGSAFKKILKYSFGIGGGKGSFIARKIKAWSLTLVLSETSTLPINVPDEDLVGDDGVLFSSLDQFLKDVPGATIGRVDLEWRLAPTLWSAYQERGKQFFESYGKISDVKAMEAQFNGELNRFLAQSRFVKELAERIAEKIGAAVTAIECVPESFSFVSNPVGENSSKFANLPNFGLKRAASFHIYFAASPRKSR